MTWSTQRNWRLCSQCSGLWFGGTGNQGACPAGGGHVPDGAANYSLVADSTTAPGQSGWRPCDKCQGLWFSGNPTQGWCAAGGAHTTAAASRFTLAAAHQSQAGENSWRWCNRCEGLWFAGAGSGGTCPAGGPHDGTGSADLRLLPVASVLRIHTKVLTAPDVDVETMLQNMREVYGVGAIDIEWVTNEELSAPDLNDLDVGECALGQATAEQNELFTRRNNAGAADVVVYFVRSTVPPLNGCAAHPNGEPGAVVAQGATEWTMAHEVGHTLGLLHVDDNDRLMTGNGTANITNPPPDLIATEIATMNASGLTTHA